MMEMGVVIFWTLYVMAVIAMLAMGVFMLIAVCGKRKSSVKDNTAEGVSVIVVARNDIENLCNVIPALIAQDYPRYEVIVVDDRSSDGTAHFLSTVQKNYSSLIKTVYVREDTPYPWPGKKFSISMGVKAASYERIVILDVADRPCSNSYLTSFMREVGDKRYVIGQCKTRMIKGLGAWWDMLVGYSGRVWAISCAVIGRPFAAQSSNFSFLKSDFLSGGAYMNNMRVPSGEASFLLQGKTRDSVRVMCGAETMVERANVAGFKTLWEKSVRRVAMWRIMSNWYRVAVVVNPVIRLFFLCVVIWGAVVMYDNWLYWAMMAFTVIFISGVYYLTAGVIKVNKMVALSPLTDVFLLPMNIIMRAIAYIRIPARWK